MYQCNACSSHNVSLHNEQEQVRYRNGHVSVSLAFCTCDECGREFIPPAVIKRNDAAIRAAKRSYDGLLAPEGIHRVRRLLGLTQEAASEVFGGGANAFSKYERGEITQSVAMDRLIRLCGNHPELLDEIRSGFHEVSSRRKVEGVGDTLLLEDWHTESYPANDACYLAGAEKRQVPVVEAAYE